MEKRLKILTMAILIMMPVSAGADTESIWSELKSDLFAERQIKTTATWLKMQAPIRAHDAALVPIRIETDGLDNNQFIKSLTLIIDNNPAPVAAVFKLTSKLVPLHIETRVRINQYTYVRAIAETNEGELYMITKYVKAAGGCSAPAMKDLEASQLSLGKMKLRQFTPKGNIINPARLQMREAQLMIRHPNYSGLQMNQVTGYYIPAHYVSDIVFKLDGEMLMKVEGAISLSEDPSIRFRFLSKNQKSILNVVVRDTEQKTFKKQWQLQSPQNNES